MTKKKYIHIEAEHNTRAASFVVPELIKLYSPKSIADVGCGLGTWLKVFQEGGVKDITGFDGAHLDLNKIVISKEQIKITDLEKEIVAERQFDLVISLEVAEHISEKNAATFVKSLCNLGQTIVFSAAIPNQGGQNHINEQWPEYWQALFAKHGYTMHDSLRTKFWNEDKIDYWYRQNMVLVTGPKSPFYKPENSPVMRLVHPELLNIYHKLFYDALQGRSGPKAALKSLAKSLLR